MARLHCQKQVPARMAVKHSSLAPCTPQSRRIVKRPPLEPFWKSTDKCAEVRELFTHVQCRAKSSYMTASQVLAYAEWVHHALLHHPLALLCIALSLLLLIMRISYVKCMLKGKSCLLVRARKHVAKQCQTACNCKVEQSSLAPHASRFSLLPFPSEARHAWLMNTNGTF